ncbi:hypothetical protein GCM10023320_51690 [Pseudonocardia adelaidensis]|uniref:GAF domain-containing protein n=2 Tax=Pseudonocardia adelaidensis TaxID=648754 RepID=A0ABP9NPZ8_9PSEU
MQVFRTDVLDGDGSAGDAVTVCTAVLDLDLETEAAARRELARLAAGIAPIVVDVSEVFVAVAGFRLLMDGVQELRRSGRRAELVVNRHLRRVAHLIGEPPDALCSTVPDALIRVRTPGPGADGARPPGADGSGGGAGAMAKWPEREAGDATVATNLVELLSGLDVPDLLAEQHLLGRLERVLAAAGGVLGVDRVGLMLLDEHDRLQAVGASDPASGRLERGQQELGIGPAIDSVRRAEPVAVPDLAKGRAHPEYVPLWEWLQHERRGSGSAPVDARIDVLVRSVLSVPVRARGRVLGSLNLVRSRPGAWSAEQLRAGHAYAAVIGVLLTLSAPGPGTAQSSGMTGTEAAGPPW